MLTVQSEVFVVGSHLIPVALRVKGGKNSRVKDEAKRSMQIA